MKLVNMRRLLKMIIIILIIILVLISIPYEIKEDILKNDKSFITLPNKVSKVATNLYSNRPSYKQIKKSYFYFDKNDFYSSVTGLVSTNSKKVIDISSYQGDVDFSKVKNQVDGIILRIGFGLTLDNKLETYIKEIKKYKIPYGIYLYSYAENKIEALKEAKFTLEIIEKYDLNPTLGVYYDIEEFYVNGKKIKISKDMYEKIIETYINYLKDYDTSVYSYSKMYKYSFNEKTKKYITWIAQYNYSFTYQNTFKMWQYTNNGEIDGINGKVDLNVMFNI